jgi:hypothetical protein
MLPGPNVHCESKYDLDEIGDECIIEAISERSPSSYVIPSSRTRQPHTKLGQARALVASDADLQSLLIGDLMSLVLEYAFLPVFSETYNDISPLRRLRRWQFLSWTNMPKNCCADIEGFPKATEEAEEDE